MIYDQFSKTTYIQKMIFFESLTIMVIDVVLWILFTYSYFISVDINSERVIFFKKLTNWVKYTLSMIYNQSYKTDYT